VIIAYIGYQSFPFPCTLVEACIQVFSAMQTRSHQSPAAFATTEMFISRIKLAMLRAAGIY
jgi:hypothetical protein